MLLGTLETSLSGILWSGKGIERAGYRNKKIKGLVRAGYWNKMDFNSTSSFYEPWNTKVLRKWTKIC